MKISKEKVKGLIEDHHKESIKDNFVSIHFIKAADLLTHNRLDLSFKLLYLEGKEKSLNFTSKIYKEHIRALTMGSFNEPSNQEKNNFNKYMLTFNKVFLDIKKNGFDNSKTLIPLSKNRSIANGAHRVASAIYLNKNVSCVYCDVDDHIYDYKFFLKRKVPNNILDIGVSKFIEYTNNVYLAFIWPSAKGRDKEIDKIIPKILYKKNIRLNYNGAQNLLTQIYYNESWLGNINDNFKGVKAKLAECFKTFEPIRVIAFQASNLHEVVKIKERIRDIFDLGKHSIHITDSKEEALRCSSMVFNDNSIHFLNHSRPNKYPSTHKKVDAFKAFISDREVCHDDVLLDGSMVLSAYGIREAKDVDYLKNNNSKFDLQNDMFERHDSELKYHDIEKLSLIYNPQYYFYFNDVKFVSFKQVYKMKKNRNETKDIADCKMMDGLIDRNPSKILINKCVQFINYEKIKLKINFLKFLRFTNLYTSAKFLQKILKRKRK